MYKYLASEEAIRMMQELRNKQLRHNVVQRNMLNRLKPFYNETAKPEFNCADTIELVAESME